MATQAQAWEVLQSCDMDFFAALEQIRMDRAANLY